MSTYRPLSLRGKPDERFDGPQPGIPFYLRDPIAEWIKARIYHWHAGAWRAKRQVIERMQIALRLRRPFELGRQDGGLVASVLDRVRADPELALDVLDYLLAQVAAEKAAEELAALLNLGGSEWEVSSTGESQSGVRQLTRRTVGPVRESIEDIRTDSERAHHHLEVAWAKLAGRNPDPSTAYREAVRAVESVAKPVVSPKNARATLGTVIADLRANPSNWSVSLEKGTVDDVANLAAMIWTSQLDRHGTDDESVPLSVSQAEADAAVYLALALVRLFAGGHILANSVEAPTGIEPV